MEGRTHLTYGALQERDETPSSGTEKPSEKAKGAFFEKKNENHPKLFSTRVYGTPKSVTLMREERLS